MGSHNKPIRQALEEVNDYFGRGDTGYAQYMTAFNRNFGGSSGGGGGGGNHNNNGGGGGDGSGCGCLIAIAVVVVLILIVLGG